MLELDVSLELGIVKCYLEHVDSLSVRISNKRDYFEICKESCNAVGFKKNFQSGLVLILEHDRDSVREEFLLFLKVFLSRNVLIKSLCLLIKSSLKL